MKRFLLIIFSLFLLIPTSIFGQSNYAFFYFEGDQQTPIYVKVEGQMQPRYGQNHFIIPNLGAGYTHFEVLFQQNEYPPQKYLLKVPDGGFRGFVLKEINKKQFALYDLQQRKYIMPGDQQENDVASENNNIPALGGPSPKPESTPIAKTITKSKKTAVANPESALLTSSATKKRSRHAIRLSYLKDTLLKKLETPVQNDSVAGKGKKKDVFMKDVVINGNPDNRSPVQDAEVPSEAMSSEAFEIFAEKLLDQEDDEGKIKLIKKEIQNQSFSTEQVRVVAQNINGQAARYDAVKMLYPHTIDPENYSKLDFLFNTPFLKEKFQQIMDSQLTK